MAERLTEIGLFIDEPVYIIKKWKKSAAINKLAQLEDILEKYDLEVEELEGQFAYECECNKQFVQLQKMWNELKEFIKLQINGLNEQLIDNDFDSDCRDISIDNFDIMLQKMQELEGEKDE